MTTIIDLTKTATYRTMARQAIEVHREALIEMGFDPEDAPDTLFRKETTRYMNQLCRYLGDNHSGDVFSRRLQLDHPPERRRLFLSRSVGGPPLFDTRSKPGRRKSLRTMLQFFGRQGIVGNRIYVYAVSPPPTQ